MERMELVAESSISGAVFGGRLLPTLWALVEYEAGTGRQCTCQTQKWTRSMFSTFPSLICRFLFNKTRSGPITCNENMSKKVTGDSVLSASCDNFYRVTWLHPWPVRSCNRAPFPILLPPLMCTVTMYTRLATSSIPQAGFVVQLGERGWEIWGAVRQSLQLSPDMISFTEPHLVLSEIFLLAKS